MKSSIHRTGGRGKSPGIAFLAIFLSLCSSVGLCLAATDPDQQVARDALMQAFLALQQAESRGANVTSAARALNQALLLLQEGSVDEARSIISDVNATIPQLVAEGDQSRVAGQVALYSFLASLAAVGVLSYLYLPRLIWRSWARAKGDWEVSAS